MSEQPYTVASAAVHLKCSHANVRNLCHRGMLRFYRVGGLPNGPIRIPYDAMEGFEESGQMPPPGPPKDGGGSSNGGTQGQGPFIGPDSRRKKNK
jgi:excisionase family DNA binding protein